MMTGEYTNAVLVALLPIIGDYCNKLELPCPYPLQTNHVQRVGVGHNETGEVQGGIVLTNGYSFAFNHGYVYTFYTSTSYLNNCDTADEIPRFTGKVRIAKDKAVTIAREKLVKLEITVLNRLLKGKPTISGPLVKKEYTLPYYVIRWSDWQHSVQVEFNAEKGRIEGVDMGGREFFKPPPRVPDDILKRLPGRPPDAK